MIQKIHLNKASYFVLCGKNLNIYNHSWRPCKLIIMVDVVLINVFQFIYLKIFYLKIFAKQQVKSELMILCY